MYSNIMTNEQVFDGLTRDQVVTLALMDSHPHIRDNTANNKGWSKDRAAMFDRLFPPDFCAKAESWSDEDCMAYAKFVLESS